MSSPASSAIALVWVDVQWFQLDRASDACYICPADEYLTSQVGGARNLEALRATKARLDPGNVFNRHPLVGL